MFILNMIHPITLILLLIVTILLIFLGHELKKSYIIAIPLFAFLAILVTHVFQIFMTSVETEANKLTWCIVVDCAFIFITLISYLWVDDIETRAKNKKSIENSLDWFWKEI